MSYSNQSLRLTTTADTSFINIDVQLVASRYRLVSWALLGILLAIIIGLLALPVSYKIALWLLLLVCFFFSQVASQQLLTISTLPTNKKLASKYQQKNWLLPDTDWLLQGSQGYLLTPYGKATDIYQAKLVSVSAVGSAMIIEFWVFEPFEKTLRSIIWQDQVDMDTWRQLNVIAHNSPFAT